MKKIILLIPLLFLITACGSDKIICTMTTPSSITDYKMEATYTIYKSGKYVKAIGTVETYTSDNIDDLKALEAQAKEQYAEYNKKYGGYVYTSSIKGNVLESIVVIDYNQIDFAKYLEDYPSLKEYSQNNKLTVDGAKELYKLLGAICK